MVRIGRDSPVSPRRLSLHRFVDLASCWIWNSLCVCVAAGLSSLVPLRVSAAVSAAVFALVIGFFVSSFEGILFAIFTRPYDAGDVILLVGWPTAGLRFNASRSHIWLCYVSQDDVNHSSGSHETSWKVERVGLWSTTVKGEGRATGSTVLANSTLSHRQVTTINGLLRASVGIRLKISLEASQQKIQVFRKVVDDYVKCHAGEWIELATMEPINVTADTTEYELLLRHRQAAGAFGSIRNSRLHLASFCFQALAHLNILEGSKNAQYKPVESATGGYNDDISEDSILDTDNELYFLTKSTNS